MALIKQTTLPSGETGDYWRLVRVDDNDDECIIAELCLYKSKTLRGNGASKMDYSVKFIIPFAEIENIYPNEDLPESWRDIIRHLVFLFIKQNIASGAAKIDEPLIYNEQVAKVLYGATDDI